MPPFMDISTLTKLNMSQRFATIVTMDTNFSVMSTELVTTMDSGHKKPLAASVSEQHLLERTSNYQNYTLFIYISVLANIKRQNLLRIKLKKEFCL